MKNLTATLLAGSMLLATAGAMGMDGMKK